MNTYATVVLAAGKGTRMRSTLPKVLHTLAGEPLLSHVLNAIETIPSSAVFASFAETTHSYRPIVVLGHEATLVETTFGERCLYAIQEEQLGTGHALMTAQHVIESESHSMVGLPACRNESTSSASSSLPQRSSPCLRSWAGTSSPRL